MAAVTEGTHVNVGVVDSWVQKGHPFHILKGTSCSISLAHDAPFSSFPISIAFLQPT